MTRSETAGLSSAPELGFSTTSGWAGRLFRVFLNPPDYSLPTLTDIPVTPELLVNPYAAFPDAAIQLSQNDAKPIATHLRTAYTLSWNATIEHELGGRFVMGASYLGSSGPTLLDQQS